LVEVKRALGYFSTSKKSGLFRCPVSFSVSENTDAESISTETDPFSGFPSGSSIVPEKVRKPPSCFALTFAPTHSSFEPSCEKAYLAAEAGAAAGAAGTTASATSAFGLSLAGLVLQPVSAPNATTTAAPEIARDRRIFQTGFIKSPSCTGARPSSARRGPLCGVFFSE